MGPMTQVGVPVLRRRQQRRSLLSWIWTISFIVLLVLVLMYAHAFYNFNKYSRTSNGSVSLQTSTVENEENSITRFDNNIATGTVEGDESAQKVAKIVQTAPTLTTSEVIPIATIEVANGTQLLTPTVAEVEKVLQATQDKLSHDVKKEHTQLVLDATSYALTYRIVHEFQKRDMPVCLLAGSHLGALRHHGFIPFGEKDVDLAVFSSDHGEIQLVLHAALDSLNLKDLQITDASFGYQIKDDKKEFLSHYIDIWFYSNVNNKVTCAGLESDGGCNRWYKHFTAKNAPFYNSDVFMPFRTQIFGTKRLPIPATNIPIEQFPFDDGGKDFWNTTCGGHRSWNNKIRLWENVPLSKRSCSKKYSTHPFVFLMEDGMEQLRQGSTVLHEIDGVH